MKLINDRTQVEIRVSDIKFAWMIKFLTDNRFIFFVKDSTMCFSADSLNPIISKIIELGNKKVLTGIILARLLILKIEKETPDVAPQSLLDIRNKFDILEKQVQLDADFATLTPIHIQYPIEALKMILQIISLQSMRGVLDRGERLPLLETKQEKLQDEAIQSKYNREPGCWAKLFSCCSISAGQAPLSKSTSVATEKPADRINNYNK